MFKQRQCSSPYTSGHGGKAPGPQNCWAHPLLGYSLRYPFLGWEWTRPLKAELRSPAARPLERRPLAAVASLESPAQGQSRAQKVDGPRRRSWLGVAAVLSSCGSSPAQTASDFQGLTPQRQRQWRPSVFWQWPWREASVTYHPHPRPLANQEQIKKNSLTLQNLVEPP